MNRKPNVIYILADDMGYGDVSALNEKSAFKTPNLDSLAENGVAFCDAHASSAVCTPSRYSIMTGRYNWRSKMKNGVLGGYSEHLIERGRKCVGDVFKEYGYRTACIGKWHLGMDMPKDTANFIEQANFGSSYDLCDGIDYNGRIENSPVTNGFDYYYGIAASLDMPPYVYIENDKFTSAPNRSCVAKDGKSWYRPGPTAEDFVHEEVLDRFCEKVLEEIELYKDNPFFIYFPMTAPHGPILPTEKFLGSSNTNEYGDFCLQCDDVVGRILRKLKDTGIYDDTIVIFTSDNGCSPVADFDELREKGHNPSYVFRGHKADIYEGGHRIPLLIQWKNGMAKGEKCDETVCLTDFFATISEILGYQIKEDEAEDSISNFALWKNPQSESVREFTVHQSIDGSLAIRNKRHKLVMCEGSGGWTAPKPDAYVYDIEDDTDDKYQLFDMQNDISESKNVIKENTAVYTELREKLAKIVKSGRSTKGECQVNNGQQVWKTVSWLG